MYRSTIYTTPIYLINLLWKLGLRLGLDSELHYFSIFFMERRGLLNMSTDINCFQFSSRPTVHIIPRKQQLPAF